MGLEKLEWTEAIGGQEDWLSHDVAVCCLLTVYALMKADGRHLGLTMSLLKTRASRDTLKLMPIARMLSSKSECIYARDKSRFSSY